MTTPEEQIVTVHIDAPPDRESWSAQVQTMLDNYADAPRETLAFLVRLLEHDILPANGRAFIAEHLKAIIASTRDDALARGVAAYDASTADPNRCIEVSLFRERERARLLAEGVNDRDARRDANDLTAKHFGISVGAVKNLWTEARDRALTRYLSHRHLA